jgi:hypothetical protein
MLWPDPDQRPRLIDIRDNLTARIAEAHERDGSAKSKAWKSVSPEPQTRSRRSTSGLVPNGNLWSPLATQLPERKSRNVRPESNETR